MRFNKDWGGYGDPKFPLSWIEYETLINPFGIINAVDYGDAGMDPYNQARTLEEIRRITREIAQKKNIHSFWFSNHCILHIFGKSWFGSK